MNLQDMRLAVQELGYAVVPNTILADLSIMAASFGAPSTGDDFKIDVLVPKTSDEAKRRSLTQLYGVEAFPLHTDGAYWRTPPHYVILRSCTDAISERGTTLVDSETILTHDIVTDLSHALWQVGVKKSRYMPALRQSIGGDRILRWDTGVMRPAHRRAVTASLAFENALQAAPIKRIGWEPGLTVILDNWRMLHAREARPVGPLNEHRRLQRVQVWKDS